MSTKVHIPKIFVVALLLSVGFTARASSIGNCTHDQKNYENLVVKFAVLQAKAGEYGDAKAVIKKLDNYDRVMGPVALKLYANNESNLGAIESMCYDISCKAFGTMMRALFEEIKSNGNLRLTETLVLAKFTGHGYGCLQTEDVQATKILLKPYLDNILDQWTTQIRRGEFSEINSYLRNTDNNVKNGEVFMPTLVKKVFELDGVNLSSVNVICNFASDLPHHQEVVPLFRATVQELIAHGKNRSEEMLLASYCVHKMIQKNNETIQQKANLQTMYANLKNEIPFYIRNILFRSTCTIKNLHKEEYLFATNEPMDGGNGTAYTLLKGNLARAGEWTLTPAMHNGQLYFHVINNLLLANSKYLCESTYTWNVVMCDGEAETKHHKWIMKPTSWQDNSSVFKFKNGNHNSDIAYLKVSDNYDSDLGKRLVKDDLADNSSYWQVQCY